MCACERKRKRETDGRTDRSDKEIAEREAVVAGGGYRRQMENRVVIERDDGVSE